MSNVPAPINIGRFPLTCPKCGQEGQYRIIEVENATAVICSYCSVEFSLNEERITEITKAAYEMRQIKTQPF